MSVSGATSSRFGYTLRATIVRSPLVVLFRSCFSLFWLWASSWFWLWSGVTEAETKMVAWKERHHWRQTTTKLIQTTKQRLPKNHRHSSLWFHTNSLGISKVLRFFIFKSLTYIFSLENSLGPMYSEMNSRRNSLDNTRREIPWE